MQSTFRLAKAPILTQQCGNPPFSKEIKCQGNLLWIKSSSAKQGFQFANVAQFLGP